MRNRDGALRAKAHAKKIRHSMNQPPPRFSRRSSIDVRHSRVGCLQSLKDYGKADSMELFAHIIRSDPRRTHLLPWSVELSQVERMEKPVCNFSSVAIDDQSPYTYCLYVPQRLCSCRRAVAVPSIKAFSTVAWLHAKFSKSSRINP